MFDPHSRHHYHQCLTTDPRVAEQLSLAFGLQLARFAAGLILEPSGLRLTWSVLPSVAGPDSRSLRLQRVHQLIVSITTALISAIWARPLHSLRCRSFEPLKLPAVYQPLLVGIPGGRRV